MTLLTDYALAALAVALGARLARTGGVAHETTRRLWTAAFLWGGAAALAGGTVHGFSASLAPVARTALWKTFIVGSGAACALVSAGTALSTLRGTWLRAALLGTAGKLALVLFLASRSDLALVAVADAAVTIAFLLTASLAKAGGDPRQLGWLLLALAGTATGLAVQRSGIPWSAWVDHNDACHLLLTAALWPFYRVGLAASGPTPESSG